MARVNPYLIKTVRGDQDLTLKADPGESFLIKDIQIYNPANNYVTLMIDRTTVGYFRVGGPLGSHLPFLPGRSAPILPAHAHTALNLDAGDSTSSIAATDLTQPLRDGAGGEITTAEVRIGDSTASKVTAEIPTSSDIITGGQVPQNGQKTLLAWMIEQGLMDGYPIAVGETFKITGAAQGGSLQMVIYESHEEGDMASDMPNGSKASTYVFVNYGNAGGNITDAGEWELSKSQNPAEFPDFPFGKVVPAKTKVDIAGILASDFAPGANDGTDQIWTSYVKLIAERETLFDEDRNGLLMLGPSGSNADIGDRVGEGLSVIGNYSDVDARLPLMIPEMLEYVGGDELQVYLCTEEAGSGQTIETAKGEVALIEKISREE
jgi:hypothetical protein